VADLQVTMQSAERTPLNLSGDLCENGLAASRHERAASNHTDEQQGELRTLTVRNILCESDCASQRVVNFAFRQPISTAGLSRAHGQYQIERPSLALFEL